uniref:Uncharacterized protein n=1 Tax=viral metagenome TaxID=1070528 RepID=A0A6C0E842_9ZZZZ
MDLDNFYASKTTLDRLNDSFDGAYLELLNLISDNFLDSDITGIELWEEFCIKPRLEKEKKKREEKEKQQKATENLRKLKSLMREKPSPDKCQAIIHIKKELRQCQNIPLPDDDLCTHHEKLDVLPYGRVELIDD